MFQPDEPTNLTDRELLDRYLRGDVAAFEEILGRHERSLLRFVARYRRDLGQTGALAWAEDTVQEVFLRLVREAQGLGEVQNISSWLYRVARNLVIDELRKEVRMEKRHRQAAGVELQPPPTPVAEENEVAGIVSKKLYALPANQRDVLILKIQEGKSYREISEITGLSTSNVGYLIHHGLKSLATSLRTAGVV